MRKNSNHFTIRLRFRMTGRIPRAVRIIIVIAAPVIRIVNFISAGIIPGHIDVVPGIVDAVPIPSTIS